MALSQSLSTGISGLISHQKAMDNIGNNLANVNTAGFKMGVYQFSTLLERSLRGGMAADAGTGRGSVNPIQLGLGTQTGSINKVFTQGDLEVTNNMNDMAIDGNGFFTLRTGNSYAYTRNGSFYRGEDGSLMAGNGLFVQGTMAIKGADGAYRIPQDAKMQDIVIPIGTVGGHSQTTKAQFMGNLNSDQPVSKGLQLYGSKVYPNVGNQQKWMNKEFNGGNPLTDPTVDQTWVSLEKVTYSISESTLAAASANGAFAGGLTLPTNVVARQDTRIATMNETYHIPTHYLDPATGIVYPNVDDPILNPNSAAGSPVVGTWPQNGQSLLINDMVPLIEDVKTINGGNVQTSAAYAVEVPEPQARGAALPVLVPPLPAIANNLTMPMWFYESTGAIGYNDVDGYADIIDTMNRVDANYVAGGGLPALTEAEAFALIWPQGINDDGIMQNYLPRKGENYAASLDTPLEHLRYLKGDSWVQPFAGIRDGEKINVSFEKGESQMEIDFVYNRPAASTTFNGQVPSDFEKSFTLGHFLRFMGGDIDEPTLAAQNISPAMFGATVTPSFPYGDPATMTADGRAAYEVALLNVQLAKDDLNRDDTGGALGLISLPPHISTGNGGPDSYDVPPESAGAYTRRGDDDVRKYMRWNPLAVPPALEPSKTGDSFRTSFVSNLGEQNQLENIRVSYNNVPHETMYANETDYAATEGGSALVTLDFYDSLGNPKTANIRMAMVSQDNDFTTWRWYADCADDTDFDWQTDENGNINTNSNVGTGLIRFDKNGNFVKGAEYSESQGITINQAYRGVNEPIWLKVLNGLSPNTTQDLDFSTMTCSATESDFRLKEQNGAPPSTLDTFTVGLDGTIIGLYENGNQVVIGRVGLAMIPNENGLIAAGDNLFYTGPASGDARYGHANTGGAGTIRHMTLESSNVDLSREFTKMISTQRGFQANGRTITTADEMIQELLNLKR